MKISISIEKFQSRRAILNFFNLWALRAVEQKFKTELWPLDDLHCLVGGRDSLGASLSLRADPPSARALCRVTLTLRLASAKALVFLLEAQQRYFSYRAIPVAIVSQNYLVFVFVGSHNYRAICCKIGCRADGPV